MRNVSKTLITIDGMSWSERELAQIIRRKMITKSEKNLKKYNRKKKHKNIDKI